MLAGEWIDLPRLDSERRGNFKFVYHDMSSHTRCHHSSQREHCFITGVLLHFVVQDSHVHSHIEACTILANAELDALTSDQSNTAALRDMHELIGLAAVRGDKPERATGHPFFNATCLSARHYLTAAFFLNIAMIARPR
jgi:hypothetical protein